MRAKEPSEQITEYYETIRNLYPHLSYHQIDEICRSGFKMIKQTIASGSLMTVRLKYIGQFMVNKGRAKGMLKKTELMFRAGKVPLKIRNYIHGNVISYFKREYNEDLPLEKVDNI